jgi:hypothetical protein
MNLMYIKNNQVLEVLISDFMNLVFIMVVIITTAKA